MKDRIRWGTIAVLAVIAVFGAACGSSSTASSTSQAGSQWTTSHPFKAAFIYVGAPSDAGWTHAHDVGRLAVQNYFGGRVQTTRTVAFGLTDRAPMVNASISRMTSGIG